MEFERTKSGRMQRGIQTSQKLDLCCSLRLKDDKKSSKEMLMCRNLGHSDLHDHCNPKRLYIVKESTIPKVKRGGSSKFYSPIKNSLLYLKKK